MRLVGIPQTVTQRRRLLLLTLIVLLAALARVAMLVWVDPIITNEGTDYLRLAQNLRDGAGYQGIFDELHSEFPPLFPALIALISPLAGGAEGAARALSVVLGAATVVPVYGIAARLGGPRAGLVGAALTAVHGLLIALSISTYSEATYFFFVACGMYFGLQTVEHWRLRAAVLTGGMFGLAYLVRPEGIVYPAVVAGFATIALCLRGIPRRQVILAMLAMVVTCTVVMTPYVAWLSERSGYLRFEGKSGINGLLSQRVRQGYTYHQASAGLGPRLEPVGADLPLDEFVVRPDSGGIGQTLRTIATTRPGRVLDIARQALDAPELASLPVILLAVLGLVTALARKRSRSAAILLALFGLSYLPVLLSIDFLWSRYLFPAALFLLPWAACGAISLLGWLGERVPLRPAWAAPLATVVLVLLVASAGVTTARGANVNGDLVEMRDYEQRDAGRWLETQAPEGKLVAALSGAPVYYARGWQLYLPSGSSAQALDYLRKLGPDFISLTSSDVKREPYVADWLEHGIPAGCAPRVASFSGPRGTVSIYRWKCGATDREWLNQWCPRLDREGTPVCTPTPPYARATRFSHP